MLMEQIRVYVDQAFADIPASRRVSELKDELVSNLMDKATDLIREGKTEQEAFNAAVAGIGDLSELAEGLRSPSPFEQPTEQERKKHALLVSVGIALGVISPFVMVLFLLQWDMLWIGLFLMFALIAASVGILVYAGMSRPKYIRRDETVVEQFKEFNGRKSRYTTAYRSFHGGYWLLVVALYFVISFCFNTWAFSWILFLIAVAVDRIVCGLFQLSRYNDK